MNDNNETQDLPSILDPRQPPASSAGFWVRGGALTLDVIIILLPAAIISTALGLPRGSYAGKALFGVLYIAYHAIMVGLSGQTIGKMAAGISVVRYDGTPVSYPLAFERALLSSFTGAMGIGYLVAVFNPGRRALHDYLADTRVVYLQPVGKVRKGLMVALTSLMPLALVLGIAAAFAIPALAPVLLKMRCESGIALNCQSLGTMYLQGQANLKKDPGLAAKYYKKACDLGLATACDALRGLQNGDTEQPAKLQPAPVSAQEQEPAPDTPAGRQTACDAGDADACAKLGYLYSLGQGVTRDLSRAAALDKRACTGGNTGACHNLALIYDEQGSKAEAVPLYEQACSSRKYPVSCFNLGNLYLNGDGVAKDTSRALELYQKSCNESHPEGCNALGTMYSYGLGIKKNQALATKYFYRACGGKVASACTSMGMIYLKGRGVKKSPKVAGKMFNQACELGSGTGCTNLGMLYGQQGFKDDSPQVTDLFRQGCEKGNNKGCFNLGAIYYNTGSFAQATTYFAMGCKLGNKQSCALAKQAEEKSR